MFFLSKRFDWIKFVGRIALGFFLCSFFFVVSAKSFAKDSLLAKSSDIEFIMAGIDAAMPVYGISALMECADCKGRNSIDVIISETSPNGEKRKIHQYSVYFSDELDKRFYSLFSFEPKAAISENLEKPIQISPENTYSLRLLSNAEISYFTDEMVVNTSGEQLDKSFRSTLVKWIAQPYTGTPFGSPLNTIDRSYSEVSSFFLSLLIVVLLVTFLLFLGYRRNIFSANSRSIVGVACGTASMAFLLYFITLCTDHPGGDSREFQLAQLAFRELHQPGDPLLAMAAALFGKLFPFGNFMYKGHLLAAILASSSIGIFSASISLFSRSHIIAVFSAAVLATGTSFWNYGVIAQNYSMSALFQALMLFYVFLVKDLPNRYNFTLSFVAAFLMLTTHPTNAYWVFFCALTILPNVFLLKDRVYSLVTAVAITAAVILVVYLPYVFFVPNPGYYQSIFVYLNDKREVVQAGADYSYVAFSEQGFHSFIRYLLGNSENQSWTSGIAAIAGSSGIVTLLKQEWMNPLRVVIFGFGLIPAALGLFGMVRLFILRGAQLSAIGLALTLMLNFVFLVCEILYFKVGYVEIFSVHAFPIYFVLSIGIAALMLPLRLQTNLNKV